MASSRASPVLDPPKACRRSAPAWAPGGPVPASSIMLAGRGTLAGSPGPTLPQPQRRAALPAHCPPPQRCLTWRCEPAPLWHAGGPGCRHPRQPMRQVPVPAAARCPHPRHPGKTAHRGQWLLPDPETYEEPLPQRTLETVPHPRANTLLTLLHRHALAPCIPSAID